MLGWGLNKSTFVVEKVNCFSNDQCFIPFWNCEYLEVNVADSAVILKSSFDCFTVAESSGFHFNLFGKIKFGTFLYSAVSKLIMEKNGEELNFHAKSLALLAMPGLFSLEHHNVDRNSIGRERMKNVFSKCNQFPMTGVDRIPCTRFPSPALFLLLYNLFGCRNSLSITKKLASLGWHSFYELSGSNLVHFFLTLISSSIRPVQFFFIILDLWNERKLLEKYIRCINSHKLVRRFVHPTASL